jgi:hypothetical protein
LIHRARAEDGQVSVYRVDGLLDGRGERQRVAAGARDKGERP